MPSELVLDLLYVAGLVASVVIGGKIYANVETKKAQIEADKERDKTRMYVDRDNLQSKLEYEVDMRGFEPEPENGDGEFDLMSLLTNPQVQQVLQNNPQAKEIANSFLNNSKKDGEK